MPAVARLWGPKVRGERTGRLLWADCGACRVLGWGGGAASLNAFTLLFR